MINSTKEWDWMDKKIKKIRKGEIKTILEYGDSEDDKMELKRVMKAGDMASLLFEVQVNMKSRIIHTLDTNDATEAEYKLIEKIWGRINEEFDAHGICIDKLITTKQ